LKIHSAFFVRNLLRRRSGNALTRAKQPTHVADIVRVIGAT
jgi:hypothetical protein